MIAYNVKTSIIIVNYNGKDELDRCLHSLIQHTNFDTTEIILVDNASTDGSVDYFKTTFPEIIVLRNPENYGFSQGNNLGAKYAQGKYLAFLNPDTMVTKSWLEPLIAALDDDPLVGLVSPKILLLSNPTVINSCGHQVHLTGLTQCRGFGAPQSSFMEREIVDAISGAAFVMRRKFFDELGGFDESFFLYNEDTDISWQARLVGYQCLYIPDSVIQHDYRLHLGADKLYYYERNRYQVLFKHLRWRTLLLLSPMLVLMEIIAVGFVLTHKQQSGGCKLRAWNWVRANWKELMLKRKAAQARRTVTDRTMLSHCTYSLAFKQVGGGFLPQLAHLVFNPVFYILKGLSFILIWW